MSAKLIYPYELACTLAISERTLRRWRKDRREQAHGKEHGPVYIQDAPGRPVMYHIDDVHNWLVVTGRGGIIGNTYYPNANFDDRLSEIERDRNILEDAMEPERKSDTWPKTAAIVSGIVLTAAIVLSLLVANVITVHQRNVAIEQARHYAEMYHHETSSRVRLLRYVQTKYALDEPTAKRLTDVYIIAGEKYDVDPRLLVSQSRVESFFNPRAVSIAGARGIMQVMPDWSEDIEYIRSPDDLFDPRINIMAGAHVLRHYLDKCGGGEDIRMALVCYHGGPDKENWGPKTLQYPDTVLAEYRKL